VQILVVNTGSSTVKFSLVDSTSEQVQIAGQVDWSDHPAQMQVRCGSEHYSGKYAVNSPREAVQLALGQLDENPVLKARCSAVAAVGHRVVHGGTLFQAGVRITDEVKRGLKQLCDLAPLHNPINLEGIEAAQHAWPGIPQVAVFDTAFHATLPAAARTFGLPQQWSEEWGLRRYGFHGLSHAYCTDRASTMLGRRDLRLVICHLGQGCSLSAVRNGVCVDTSMGFTPLDGLVMGTRSGSVDPGLLIHAMRHHRLSADDLDRILNRESGLLGLSGLSNDMRQLQEAADAGNQRAGLSIEVFLHRLRQTIGATAAVLGGIDALVFTAGIGENSVPIRRRACEGLEFLGLHLDQAANERCRPDADIATKESPGRILVLRTHEDLTIVRETVRVLRAEGQPG
jgi:acetate kinase